MGQVTQTEERREPWSDASFRNDLRAYAAGGAELSRRYADDAVLLARLAAQVPRERWDTRGATAWTSFLGEVAVARAVSTQAAAAAVADAQQLVRLMPFTLALLQQGRLPVGRARALVDATRPCPDAVVRLADAELAERACHLVPARVRAAVDRLALQHDVDAAAARAARASAGRGTRVTPLADVQSELSLSGPAAVLAQVQSALDADAREWLAALRGTGDERGIDQLRFDLGVHRLLGRHSEVVGAPAAASDDRPSDGPCDLPSLPDAGAPSWFTDRRFSRPVRLDVSVPVTTLLGLTDEPCWLAGYGWVAAPLVRQWLPVSELRQACVAADGPAAGQLVDLADTVRRPAADPASTRRALLDMATTPFVVTDKTWREQGQHDPSGALAEFVRLRDRSCDGPFGGPLRARDTDLDHDLRYDDGPPQPPPVVASRLPRPREGTRVRHGDLGLELDTAGTLTMVDLGHEDVDLTPWRELPDAGPTAAWNLVARGRRAHGLKHRGWTPLRTATSTLWSTPAGQCVEVPHELHPPALALPGRRLRDPQLLHDREAAAADARRVAVERLAPVEAPAEEPTRAREYEPCEPPF